MNKEFAVLLEEAVEMSKEQFANKHVRVSIGYLEFHNKSMQSRGQCLLFLGSSVYIFKITFLFTTEMQVPLLSLGEK